MGLRAPEWIVVAYYAYLAVAAAVVPRIARPHRWRALCLALAVLLTVFTIAAFDTAAMWWREWLPLAYIVIGYRPPAPTRQSNAGCWHSTGAGGSTPFASARRAR